MNKTSVAPTTLAGLWRTVVFLADRDRDAAEGKGVSNGEMMRYVPESYDRAQSTCQLPLLAPGIANSSQVFVQQAHLRLWAGEGRLPRHSRLEALPTAGPARIPTIM